MTEHSVLRMVMNMIPEHVYAREMSDLRTMLRKSHSIYFEDKVVELTVAIKTQYYIELGWLKEEEEEEK